MSQRKFPIIHIIGLPGAGKTTLAKSLSKRLKLPIYRIGTYRSRFPSRHLSDIQKQRMSKYDFQMYFNIF